MPFFCILYVLFFSSVSLAILPKEFKEHIEKNRENLLTIKTLGLDDKQEEMLIERYVDAMALKYDKINFKDYFTNDVVNNINKLISKIHYNKKQEETEFPLERKFIKFLNKHHLKIGDNQIANYPYKGFSIPFKATRTYLGEHILELLGISKDLSNEEDNSCLILKFEKNKTMEISWLGAVDSVCPIPKKTKVGTFLLKMAEKLARQLNIKVIKLQDQSTVVCDKCGKKAWLADLKIFEYGTTWYGSYGFYSEKGKKNDLKKYEAMWGFSIFSALYFLEEMKEAGLEDLKEIQKQVNLEADHLEIEKYYNKFLTRKTLLENAIKQYEYEKFIDPENDISLGEFFTWLWKNDCGNYIKIMKLVFPDSGEIVLNEDFHTLINLRRSEQFYYKYL